jgi:hypothetical protein
VWVGVRCCEGSREGALAPSVLASENRVAVKASDRVGLMPGLKLPEVSVKGWPCLACDAFGVAADIWAAAAGAWIRAAGAGGDRCHGSDR